MYQNIPEELRQLPQWVCVGLGKVPLNPHTGMEASVIDRKTWSSFDHALQQSRGGGIGFVFTQEDPYVFIDLDDPYSEKKDWTPEQRKRYADVNSAIYNMFPSYAELSQSGKGVHIICKGHVPSGHRRDTVELYGSARYAIFTGNVLKKLPITEQTWLVTQLYGEMQPKPETDLVQVEGVMLDAQVVDMASSAINGPKFDLLCAGDWVAMGFPSQSEADFALMSIIAFYTPDNEQVRRLFRMSALGKREKAIKDNKHLDRMLRKIRAEEPPLVDLSKLTLEVKGAVPPVVAPEAGRTPEAVVQPVGVEGSGSQAAAPHNPTVTQDLAVPQLAGDRLTLPPGLVGRVAHYIYESAPKPVPEVAIAAALAVVAGIAGRSYNISKTGLNQYIILLAPTGSGKDGAADGIDRLLAEVRTQVPMVMQFKGPAVFSSGQGLLRVLEKKPCFFAVLGEFGLTLQQISKPTASSAEVMLRRVLLDLYTKSGKGRVLDEAAYSDREKNTQVVYSPSVTILGESVPNRFYDALDVGAVEEGLVPRFLIIETNDNGPPRNKGAGFAPPPDLVKAMAELASTVCTMQANNSVSQVAIDHGGEAVLDTFEKHCDAMRRNTTRGADQELWSRAALKAVKLAGLIAVGNSLHQPTVTADIAQWAVGLVQRTTENIVRRFEAGEIGSGEIQFESEVRKAIVRYTSMTKAQRLNAKCPADAVDHGVVPFAYLRDQLRRRQSFRDSKVGVTRAIEIALKDACDAGILLPISMAQCVQLGIRSRVFGLGEG